MLDYKQIYSKPTQLWVKITSFIFNDNSGASSVEITGLVTGGNISVNGNSAVRRSGSLSCIVDDTVLQSNVTDIGNTIAINKRIQIYLAITNENEKPTSWLNQGVYVITGANVQHSTQGTTISVNFKDQMVLLNGECGGMFSRSMVHTPIYDYSQGGDKPVKTPVTFRTLIKTLVKEYTNLKDSQIHIKLDEKETDTYQESYDKIDQIISWTGSNPIYLFTNEGQYAISLTEPETYDEKSLNILVYGDAMGYQRIPFTYPVEKELTSNTGESVVSVLDKIKATLGNFEYFFDIKGEFYFQPIANFQHKGMTEDKLDDAITNWQKNNNISVEYGKILSSGAIQFDFTDLSLVTAFTNSPKFDSVKNDLSITGVRGDNKQMIQYHLVFEDASNTKLYNASLNSKTFALYTDSLGVTRVRIATALDTIAEKKFTDYGGSDYRTKMYLAYIANEADLSDFEPYEILWGKELKEWWPHTMSFSINEKGELKDTFLALQSLPSSLHNLNYYFEMIDMSNYSLNISQIGHRPKSLNNDKVNVIFQTEPVSVYCVVAGKGATTAAQRKEALAAIQSTEKGFIQIPESFGNSIAQGVAQNSAYDNIRSMVHTTIQYNESVNITTVPIYELEPNTLILAKDPGAGVPTNTIYEVKSFSIPLTHNGTMSLSCVRATTMI